MNWGNVNGYIVALGANGLRYQIHVIHGRQWLASEWDGAMKQQLAAQAFDGPGSARKSREWCEVRAVLQGASATKDGK